MAIIDLYDDPSASVLRHHLVRTGGGLPTKLASFELQAAALDAVPDRLFALVGTQAGDKIRKYAMHDAEHVATSIVYFLECGGQLDPDTRAKVANNLITACGWYQTTPPEALIKVAFVGQAVNGALALTAAPAVMRQNKAKNLDSMASLRQAQMAGVKEAQRAVSTTDEAEASRALDRFIRGEEADDAAALYQDYGNGYPNPFSDPRNLMKGADTRGTEMGSFGGLSSDPRPATPQKRFATAPKVAGMGEVMLSRQLVAEPAAATHYALPQHELYPIDTPAQVKRASAYFTEHHRAFEMDDRRIFAQSVAHRAETFGIPASYTIEKLAGDEYGPHILPELHGRIRMLEGTGKEAAYEVLLENYDRTPPIVMYDMLKLADRETGLDAGYGRPVTGVLDPLSAVFGAPERPIYSWAGKGTYTTEEILRSYSKLVPDLDKIMGEGWSARFANDPVGVFDKLPDEKKIIVARLAHGEAFRTI